MKVSSSDLENNGDDDENVIILSAWCNEVLNAVFCYLIWDIYSE